MSLPDHSLRIERVPCTANLPAPVWRALANAERPRYHPGNLAAVEVTDGDEVVYCLSAPRYAQLMQYIDRLERGAQEDSDR